MFVFFIKPPNIRLYSFYYSRPTMGEPKLEWFARGTLPIFGSTGIRILKMNRIPQHIAFIMDGNRRYARSNHLESVVKGHSKGFDQLTRVGFYDYFGIAWSFI